jgi:glycine/D-amino acid oxidase-like deaminating enzyme
LVRATGATRLGVIGCGAIGLTTARLAQMAGLRVRIYCAERPPEVRSSAATGVWSPESRICTEAQATPAFTRQWEAMARFSFQRFQSLLGLAGEPVMWQDGYFLSDVPFDADLASVPAHDEEPDYPDLEDLIGDIRPRSVLLQPQQHPFSVPHVRRYTQMVFNLPAYTEWLMNGFMRDGGEIITRRFEHPRQLSSLPEPTLVNATGWGARALWGDDSLIPVRGQTARLVPQAGVNYGLQWRGHNLFMVSRKDGILVQAQSVGDWGNADATPDRAASVAAVERLAGLFRPG